MMLIDANKAHHGLAILAHHQTAGRGQRGRQWQAAPGHSILLSIITTPPFPLSGQFLFSALVSVAIAQTVQAAAPNVKVHIKWPNDIIVGDKKAGGILIENVIRGSHWAHSVIGLGLNVLQPAFPPHLPHATSLLMAAGIACNVPATAAGIRNGVVAALQNPPGPETIMTRYNTLLYKAGADQLFSIDDQPCSARILSVSPDGALHLALPSGQTRSFQHGQLTWLWH